MKVDIRKMLAVLSQGNEKESLFVGEKRDIEVPFLSKGGTVLRRFIRIYMPDNASRPMPLVFVTHYEMQETDTLMQLYLRKGWAVSTAINVEPYMNGELFDDDLVFNNAALTVVKKQPEVDKKKIIISGGSAGGYMTMLLSILRMGICASVCFSGFLNSMFDLKYYMPAAQAYNEEAMKGIPDEDRQNLAALLEKLPLPFCNVANPTVIPSLPESLDKREDSRESWRRFSPVNMADCLTNPVLFTHFTSDVLLPVDQLTRHYTYEKPGESLPADFKMKLSDFPLPEEFQYSMEEVLPREELSEMVRNIPEGSPEILEVMFDAKKRFNIAVFDDGPAEGTCGHSKDLNGGTVDATTYMKIQMDRTVKETNWLTAGKLALMAEQYARNSILLPAQRGIDDTVYGSLAMDQKIVLDELGEFAKENADEWKMAINEAKTVRPDLEKALTEICERL